jgi:hypothetical protein
MARREYALERGGPKELRLRWGWGMKDFEARLGAAAWKLDRPALEAGARLVLPDGSTLLLQRPSRPWYSMDSRGHLIVERNGLPVPGSDGDPRVVGRRAASLILLFGLVRFAVAGAMIATQPAGSALASNLAIVAALGLALLVLGILAALGKRTPVLVAAVVFGLEALAVIATGSAANPGGVVIQALVIVHLVRAWRRMEPRQPQPSLASVFE